MLTMGKKIFRCSECSKAAHKSCADMIPCFCGLAPGTADVLIQAFKDHEEILNLRRIKSAENVRLRILTIDHVDVFQIPKGEPKKVKDDDLISLAGMSIVSETIIRQDTRNHSVTRYKTTFKPSNLSITDFHLNAVIGRGAFGKILLATDIKTNKIYAIKTIKKDALKRDDVSSVKVEKAILQMAGSTHHPFMVNLHSSFDTDTRIFFVMEYISGGDLMTHLQMDGNFSHDRARFYACEVLLGLQFMHENHIIYRYIFL